MEKIYRILGKRGRTTIPYSLRLQMGLHPNDLLSYCCDGDTIVIRREKICDKCGQNVLNLQRPGSEELCSYLSSLPIEVQRQALLDLSIALAMSAHK